VWSIKLDFGAIWKLPAVILDRSVGNVESVISQIVFQVDNRAVFVGDSCLCQCQQLILFGKSAPQDLHFRQLLLISQLELLFPASPLHETVFLLKLLILVSSIEPWYLPRPQADPQVV
jgi:hypothetical protein